MSTPYASFTIPVIGEEAVRLLTANEVAAILRVKPARVYEMSRLRLLPTVRMGRQVRYDESALLEWIKAGGSTHSDPGSKS